MTSRNVRKPKEEVVNVRLTSEQKAQLESVAASEGLGLSTWILHVSLLAAKDRQAASPGRGR